MFSKKKILCPLDFSGPSHQALLKAIELASDGDVELTLLHVLSPCPSGSDDTCSERLWHSPCDETRKDLDDVIRDNVPAHVKVRKLVRQGDVTTEILRAAAAQDIDLIVMATHGATGWREFVLGSVTDEVVRLAPCPVLTMSEAVRSKSEFSFAGSISCHKGGEDDADQS